MSPEPLRVGLNLVFLVEDSGGAGRYARELIRSLRVVDPDISLTAFVSSELPADVREAEWAQGIEFVRFPITVTHGPPGNIALTMGAQWGAIPLLARRHRLHLVHGLANIVPVFAPGVATVATVLDLIWMRFPNTLSR